MIESKVGVTLYGSPSARETGTKEGLMMTRKGRMDLYSDPSQEHRRTQGKASKTQ